MPDRNGLRQQFCHTAANVLNASTSGASGKADSSASLVDVDVLSGHPAHLTASLVRSQTQATCDGLSGSSEIVNMTFGGQDVVITGEPNQTVTLPGVATLIINEQTQTQKGRYGQIRVNALHLIVPGVAEVILSASESDINCVPPTAKAPCHDFVTGGGFILTPTGNKGNFGFHAGIKNDAVSGHLHYIDHGARVKVKSTKILVYSATGPTSRHIEGEAEINGVPGTFSVDVSDEGEPGGYLLDPVEHRLRSGGNIAGRKHPTPHPL
ncbi:MAG: hypothetical protein KY468_06500 [Armatimonadetes bacterium]|nr:hypothetical protein [Armatimonadota bacterium]